jgi:putative copper export protein
MALAADLIIIAVPVLILSVIGQAFLLADRLGGPDQLRTIFFNTRTGELWIARLGVAIAILLLLLPALISERYRRGDRTLLVVAVALAGGAGLLMTYSLNSHASTCGGQFWSITSDFAHLLATAAGWAR